MHKWDVCFDHYSENQGLRCDLLGPSTWSYMGKRWCKYTLEACTKVKVTSDGLLIEKPPFRTTIHVGGWRISYKVEEHNVRRTNALHTKWFQPWWSRPRKQGKICTRKKWTWSKFDNFGRTCLFKQRNQKPPDGGCSSFIHQLSCLGRTTRRWSLHMYSSVSCLSQILSSVDVTNGAWRHRLIWKTRK